ncbi:MAG: hypothetical protein BJBARM5_0368 [Candidatus Parvarchaeum acidophilus ARMAN-5]|jgi:hypothetical protein|uniref:Uncharacterized protein n=1 Tax=Candidatus Parvarchaeum acidophilus ARMAN-5 TaxID=662762 RepID=D6GV63_PARA5|nr:MAG: hypothetical protein BJBARM5_0368 [Candidatus Parvarchaeum acidophilus ARMAN-5]
MEKVDKKQENIVFYHIGRVVKVINKNNAINIDKKSKAVIEMWDNNVITCEVTNNNVKDNNFVIVQFNGVAQVQGMFMKPVTITDVLNDETGQEIWDKYKGFLDKSKPTHPFTG